MNKLVISPTNPEAVNQIYNTSFVDRTTFTQLMTMLKELLAECDPEIADLAITYGPLRKVDIQHSLASIDIDRQQLDYIPQFPMKEGLKDVVRWYWENLKMPSNPLEEVF